MSAKVVKKESAASATPFVIAEINSAGLPEETADHFSFEEFNTQERDVVSSNPETMAHTEANLALHNELLEAEREKAQAVESEAAQKIAEMQENLFQTMGQLDRLRHDISANAEDEIVELALEIAKKVVSREVMFDREIALTLVKVSLKKIDSRAPIAKIHLHPEDHAYIESRRDQIDFRGTLELIADRSISPGGCLVHTENGEIDARIESQFEEIAHALLGK